MKFYFILKYIFLFCFSFISVSSICAQNFEDNYKIAEEYFANADYYSAAHYYKKCIEKDSLKLDIIYKFAEASRLFNDYKPAESYYRKVFQQDVKNLFPQCEFWLAVTNKSNGKYDEAKLNFENFYNKHKTDNSYFSKKAFQEIAACNYAKKLKSDTISVKVTHLGEAINSPYSEFAAFQLSDSVLQFSALRPDNTEDIESIIPNTFSSRIFQSRSRYSGWEKAKPLDMKLTKNDYYIGNSAMSANNKRVYFSRCKMLNSSKVQCELCMSFFREGKWQEPVKLNSKINKQGYTATQPFVVSDGTNGEIMYFVSDKPGGQGNLDIWYTMISPKLEFSEPVNCGSSINTMEDDISPFYYLKTKTLYFSSTWHKGLGGYDIFRSNGSLDKWAVPENVGYPLNTSYNDIYFTINQVDSDGYFTSNRPGSFYIKGETCCNDIFSYEWDKNAKPVKKKDTLATIVVLKAELPQIRRRDSLTVQNQIKKLLPLSLYFHNDEPNPQTMSTTTEKSYETTLIEYFRLKERYKREYARGLKGNEKLKAEKDIDDFFNDYVTTGFEKLKLFSDLLLKDLENGKVVKITVKGYCSPLASGEYNKALAKRRIGSIINYLYDYKGGAFFKYFKGTASNGGKLIIVEEPLGEEKADIGVSDNPNDKRNSIFSRAAAMERKIKILYYDSEIK